MRRPPPESGTARRCHPCDRSQTWRATPNADRDQHRTSSGDADPGRKRQHDGFGRHRESGVAAANFGRTRNRSSERSDEPARARVGRDEFHRVPFDQGQGRASKGLRLDSIRPGATRFEAAIGRGLSPYVGREHEMDILERGLAEARNQLNVIDVMAEPGMGKSRLLHEFRQRIGKERAFVLLGSCSPDGQQTSFLPFIEVVRGSFRLSAGEAEKDVAQKLEMGLIALGLHTPRNVGLLLHLLGLKVPDGALVGLDGVLIGLRTRELMLQLLEARCRLSPVVVMVIEDLHWIDSVSEEVLGKIVDSQTKLRLLLLHTRRPEYVPPWLDRTVVTKLHLESLPTGDIRRLAQARLGVEVLPEALARQVTEKAEGNPLFAEEIVSFLTERGVLRVTAGKVEFDSNAVAAALPASVQSL